jgi:chemotaxis protein MotA
MDLASIVGFIACGAIIAVVLILDGGSPAELFAHPAAILLIFGGSIAAVTISSPLKAIMLLPRLIMMAFQEKKLDTAGTIEILVKMADKARREGLLTLEDESKKINDDFMKKGIMMIVDGTDPAQVREILDTNIEHTRMRHRRGYGLFSAAGGFSPTFGIIGTVMGLISVLKQLDDPNKLAKSIASAFLATLWGLLSANMIFLPISAKLKSKSEEELAYKYMIMEGILSIQAGENPRILREKLSAFLPPAAAKGKPAAPVKAPATKAASKAEA